MVDEIITRDFIIWTSINQIVWFGIYLFIKRFWNANTLLAILGRMFIFVIPVIIQLKIYPGNDFLFFFVNFGILLLWLAILTYLEVRKKAKQKE